jgi:hypothetical protein
MGTSKAAGARLHDALHRLPGMPAHARAAELNANAAARRLHRRLSRNRPPRNPDGHHGRPPRVLAGWQAWIGGLFGQEQR